MKKFLFILTVVLLIIGIAFVYLYKKYDYYINTPVDPAGTQKIIVTVAEGQTTKEVISALYEKQLILNKTSVEIYVKLENLDTEIRSGKYILTQNLTPIEIIEKLINPEETEIATTIKEGYKAIDIENLLVKNELIKEGEFINCLKTCSFPNYDFIDQQPMSAIPYEGYLFPDTYFVDPVSFDNKLYIQRLLDTFGTKLNPELRDAIKSQGKSITDVIIMASIIEKEVRTEKDLPIVSGILWKRLANDWPLGADATLLYEKNNNELTNEDLLNDSPYNTRINKGLPPGAICNPGLKSIKAAIYPEESEYWFYLTTKDGEVVYAVTNEEHEQNKAQYL